MHGGSQDRGRRPGTENVPYAVGLATAAELTIAEHETESRRLRGLRDRLESAILSAIPDAVIHARGAERAPHVLNVSVPGTDSESLLMALDLLGESGKILAVPGNGQAEIWHYVSLRVPLLVQRFLPFSALLGTLIAFTGLNQNSEVVAMKAAGLSAHQILAPLILASLGISVAAFAFNEGVAVNSARMVNAWSDNDYHPIRASNGVLSNVWVRADGDLIHARIVNGRGPGLQLQGVTIYERSGRELQRVIDAEQASLAGKQWRLQNVRTYDTGMNVVLRQKEVLALPGVMPDRFTLAKVNADERSFIELRQDIADLEAAGRPSEEARAGLWHKFSGPLSIVLMPLLAAIAAFGLARSGQVLLRAAAGMALGFAYFVIDNLSLALGNVGAYPAWLAAWAPFVLFLLIGEAVLVRSEE
jgi:lipopolysaccharide export system permease protein